MDINATNALTLYKKKLRKEVEGIQFGYKPPYEGDKDVEMEMKWVAKVAVLDDVLALIDA